MNFPNRSDDGDMINTNDDRIGFGIHSGISNEDEGLNIHADIPNRHVQSGQVDIKRVPEDVWRRIAGNVVNDSGLSTREATETLSAMRLANPYIARAIPDNYVDFSAALAKAICINDVKKIQSLLNVNKRQWWDDLDIKDAIEQAVFCDSSEGFEELLKNVEFRNALEDMKMHIINTAIEDGRNCDNENALINILNHTEVPTETVINILNHATACGYDRLIALIVKRINEKGPRESYEDRMIDALITAVRFSVNGAKVMKSLLAFDYDIGVISDIFFKFSRTKVQTIIFEYLIKRESKDFDEESKIMEILRDSFNYFDNVPTSTLIRMLEKVNRRGAKQNHGYNDGFNDAYNHGYNNLVPNTFFMRVIPENESLENVQRVVDKLLNVTGITFHMIPGHIWCRYVWDERNARSYMEKYNVTVDYFIDNMIQHCMPMSNDGFDEGYGRFRVFVEMADSEAIAKIIRSIYNINVLKHVLENYPRLFSRNDVLKKSIYYEMIDYERAKIMVEHGLEPSRLLWHAESSENNVDSFVALGADVNAVPESRFDRGKTLLEHFMSRATTSGTSANYKENAVDAVLALLKNGAIVNKELYCNARLTLERRRTGKSDNPLQNIDTRVLEAVVDEYNSINGEYSCDEEHDNKKKTKINPFGPSSGITNPFGASSNPFGASSNPFGASSAESSVNSPFGSSSGITNPFGASSNPFGASSNPFGASSSESSVDSPFGSSSRPIVPSIFGRPSSSTLTNNPSEISSLFDFGDDDDADE